MPAEPFARRWARAYGTEERRLARHLRFSRWFMDEPVQPAHSAVIDVGSIVGERYRVERLLGEGGMGVVFRAVHIGLDHRVAVKVLRDELTENAEVVERMLREARTAARFRSEHVARVLDVGTFASGAPYLVMEYLEGSDLATYLFDVGRLPVELAVSLMLQCCEAVAEAHAAGIIHRDLKPENLFLTTRADDTLILKVLDFGISKNVGAEPSCALTQPTVVVGSPEYMSPEQMRAYEQVDARADIWSLGAILYELLTGRQPFEAETLPAVCARVLAEEPLPPRLHDPSITAELEAIVMRCLRKERDERYQTVVDLSRALAPLGPRGSHDYAERIQRVASGVRRMSIPPEEGARAISQRAFLGLERTPPSRRAPSPPPTVPSSVRLVPFERTRNSPEPFPVSVTAKAPLPEVRSPRRRLALLGTVVISASAFYGGILVHDAAFLARMRNYFRPSPALVHGASELAPAEEPVVETPAVALPDAVLARGDGPGEKRPDAAVAPAADRPPPPSTRASKRAGRRAPREARPESRAESRESSREERTAEPTPSEAPVASGASRDGASVDAWDPNSFGGRR
jgi:serine/threonine-protein kinase